MDERLKRRAARIRQVVPLAPLLFELGYPIDPKKTFEQQFSCDLHGGRDKKPSARYYVQTNSTYCWACQKSRTSIDYLVDREGMAFEEAIRHLEQKHNLPPLPEYPDEEVPAPVEETTSAWDSEVNRVENILMSSTIDRDGPMSLLLHTWAQYDRCVYEVASGLKSPNEGVATLRTILDQWRRHGESSIPVSRG